MSKEKKTSRQHTLPLFKIGPVNITEETAKKGELHTEIMGLYG